GGGGWRSVAHACRLSCDGGQGRSTDAELVAAVWRSGCSGPGIRDRFGVRDGDESRESRAFGAQARVGLAPFEAVGDGLEFAAEFGELFGGGPEGRAGEGGCLHPLVGFVVGLREEGA